MTQVTISKEEYEHLRDQVEKGKILLENAEIIAEHNRDLASYIHNYHAELTKEQLKNEALKNSLIGKFILWLKGVKYG